MWPDRAIPNDKEIYRENLSSALHFPYPDRQGRISLVNGVGLQRFGGHRTYCQYRMTGTIDSRTNYSLCSNPYPVGKINFSCQQVKTFFSVIMVPGQQHRPLRKADIIAQLYLNQVVNPDLFSYPAMVANSEQPWVLNIHCRFNYHSLAYLCTEKSQYKNLKTAEGIHRIQEEQQVAEIPEQLFQFSGTGPVPLILKSGKLDCKLFGHFVYFF